MKITIKEKLAKLIDVRTIVTVLLTGGALWGFIAGVVTAEQFIPLVIMVIGFYFGKKDEK